MRRLFSYLSVFILVPFFAFTQDLEGIDEIAPFSEGLAAVRKGDQWGFIDKTGAMVIDFRNDIYWNQEGKSSDEGIKSVRYPKFKNGLCIVEKVEEEIAIYGFIDKEGNLAIEHQFMNVLPFNEGYTTGVLVDKVFRGKNEFNLNIYEHKFHDVLMDAKGEVVEFFGRRYNIQLNPRRYELPAIHVKILSPTLVAHFNADKQWKVHKMSL